MYSSTADSSWTVAGIVVGFVLVVVIVPIVAIRIAVRWKKMADRRDGQSKSSKASEEAKPLLRVDAPVNSYGMYC